MVDLHPVDLLVGHLVVDLRLADPFLAEGLVGFPVDLRSVDLLVDLPVVPRERGRRLEVGPCPAGPLLLVDLSCREGLHLVARPVPSQGAFLPGVPRQVLQLRVVH